MTEEEDPLTMTKKRLSEFLDRIIDDLERATAILGDLMVRLDNVRMYMDAKRRGPPN